MSENNQSKGYCRGCRKTNEKWIHCRGCYNAYPQLDEKTSDPPTIHVDWHDGFLFWGYSKKEDCYPRSTSYNGAECEVDVRYMWWKSPGIKSSNGACASITRMEQ